MFAFWASISCALFQKISDALKWLAKYRSQAPQSITNYLDDFLFVALTLIMCNHLIQQFLDLCNLIGIPIVLEKTEWGAFYNTFLGILLDGASLTLAIPLDKKTKVLNLLTSMVARKKATVREIQGLCGTLNFLNKAIFLGSTFVWRMYAKFAGSMTLPSFNSCAPNSEQMLQQKKIYRLKQHHHINLDAEFKADCKIWIKFLDNESSKTINQPMVGLWAPAKTSTEINFYSDSSAAKNLGYGCVFQNNWIHGIWEPGYIKCFKPSIEYLELFALCTGVLTWESQLRNCRIILFCDNQAVVQMVNSISSSCWNCMYLLRILVLNGLIHN